MKLRWSLALIAGIILAAFNFYPQARLLYHRGANWQGHYALTDHDEVAYAAYLQALIDGKPRKNDPYSELENTSEKALNESLFSIQFAAPYLAAVPARFLGLSAPSAMIAMSLLAPLIVALTLFWLIRQVTRRSADSFAGSLAVVCFGALAAGQGAIFYFLDYRVAGPFFPGLRRYVPAIPLIFLFVFAGLVWKLLCGKLCSRERTVVAAAAVGCFGVMVFSYLYIWTAAAAWIACVAAIWVVFRPNGWKTDLKFYAPFCCACLAWLLPYAFLVSGRAATTDDTQLLVFTHSPDFSWVSEYLGAFVILILGAAGFKRPSLLRNRRLLFAGSLALVPFAVHNQQIVTGRELQPYHYDNFVANYFVLLSLVLAGSLLLRFARPFRLAVWPRAYVCGLVGMLAIGWGAVECFYTGRVLDSINAERDGGLAISRRLKEISAAEGIKSGNVIIFYEWLGDDIAASIAQPILWSLHQSAFGSISSQESKERYYQQLYFKNIDRERLVDKLRRGDPLATMGLFDAGRVNSYLTSEFSALTDDEIEKEAMTYEDYTAEFEPLASPGTVLSFAVVPLNQPADMSRIDRWYDREEVQIFEHYILYRLSLRKTK